MTLCGTDKSLPEPMMILTTDAYTLLQASEWVDFAVLTLKHVKSGSSLIKIMACHLSAPNDYQNQYCLIRNRPCNVIQQKSCQKWELFIQDALRVVIGQINAILVQGVKSSFISLCQNGRHFVDDIFRCIFMKEKFFIFVFLKFHWSLFPRVQLTITQHWFR